MCRKVLQYSIVVFFLLLQLYLGQVIDVQLVNHWVNNFTQNQIMQIKGDKDCIVRGQSM